MFNTPEEREKRKELVGKLKQFIENVKDLPRTGGENWGETLSSECRKSEKVIEEYKEYLKQKEQ